MACRIENIKYKGQGIESKLGEKLIQIFNGNLEEAKEVYDRVASSEFQEQFGNWTQEFVPDRTYDSGEPLVIEKRAEDFSKHYYFELANGDRSDILVREFNSFPRKDLTSQVKEITHQLAFNIYKNHLRNDFENIDAKSFNIKNEIDSFLTPYKQMFSNFIEENGPDQAIQEQLDTIENIYTHIDEFQTEIIKFFSERKISILEDSLEDRTQEAQDLGLQGGDIIQSFEKNSKDNATANVKLMLSFLEKQNNLTGEPVTGNIFGEPIFRPYDSVHKELQTELADITSLYLAGEVTDVYNVMLSKVKELAKTKKSYVQLVSILDSLDENKRTEFVQAFYLSKVNFYTTTIGKNKTGTFFRVQNVSDVQNPVKKKLTEYNVNFRSRFVNEDGKLNKKAIKDLLNKTVKAHNLTKRNRRTGKLSSDVQFNEQHTTEMQLFFEVLTELGVDGLDAGSFSLYLRQQRPDEVANAYNIMFNSLFGKLSNLKNLLVGINNGGINPVQKSIFEHYSNFLFNGLAEAELFFEEDLGENTIRSGGKTYWTFARPSYISSRVSTFKQNPTILENTLDTVFGKSSMWARHLLGRDRNPSGDYKYSSAERESRSANRLENLEHGVFNTFQEEGRGIEGNDNKSIAFVDQLSDSMNKALGQVKQDKDGKSRPTTPIYSTITPADKSRLSQIKIDFFIQDVFTRLDGERPVFKTEVLKTFTNYLVSELERQKQAYNELQNLPSDKLRLYYHTDGQGNIKDSKGKLTGNAFKVNDIFTELSPENIAPDLNEKLGLYNLDYSPKSPGVSISNAQKDIIAEIAADILYKRITEDMQELQDIGIFRKGRQENTGAYSYVTDAIDQMVLNNYQDQNILTESAYRNLVADYAINSMIANIEYTKLFTGDPANYKNMVDFFKRVPSTYTDGTNLRLGMTPNDAFFKAAVLPNIIKESNFLKKIRKSLDATDLSESEKEYILQSYTKVNQTDAQGYITLERWAFLISRTGKWNSKYDAVYNKLKKGQTLSGDELKFAAQPLKGVYFGLTNGTKPVYLKYSQAVLIPQLVEGTELEYLADAMKGVADEAIVVDGIKVGAEQVSSLVDEANNILPKPTLNTLTLENKFWKLQQDLPVKTLKDTLLGSQIQKNIFSSLVDDGVYNIEGGEAMSGLEIKQAINDTLSVMSNNAITQLSIDLGMGTDGKIDVDKVYKVLERELSRNGIPTNLLQSVQKNLPIEATPGIKDKLYQTLFSKVRSSAVKIKTFGGSFIQVSNFGLDKTTADQVGVKWLVDPSELAPPVIEQDAEGKKHIVPGQVFVSHSQIAKLIPNYKELTTEQLNAKIDPRLLRAIGYRIPNQGQSSNDPVQIVGILPEGMSDSIVAYTEITTKTGSDFDIDKMYVFMPNATYKINNPNFKAAKSYIASKGLTWENMYDLMASVRDDVSDDKFSTEAGITEMFIKNHIFNPESPLDYHNDFIKEGEIGAASKLDYLVPSSDLAENNLRQQQNRLFELYWSVLTNEKTYGDLITPVDFPHIENKIKELHGDNSKQAGDYMLFHDPIYNMRLKFKYHGGKSGVGITANMLVDHNRSRGLDIAFRNYNLGIGHANEFDETVFDKEYSEELNGTKYKIRDTISAFLNAFVDIAKDPYIYDGNFNNYTSSVTFMLIRAGVHPDYIVAFIGQPILKDLAEFASMYESKVSRASRNTSKSAVDVFVENYIGDDKIDYDKDAVTEPAPYSHLVSNIKNNDFNKQQNLDLIRIFRQYVQQGKKLNESVQLSRFDTIGAGSNLTDLISFTNRIKEMRLAEQDNGSIYGHFKKYYNDGVFTSLGTQVVNTLVYLNDMLDSNPSLFLLGSRPVRDLANALSVNLLQSSGGSRGLMKNEDVGKLFFDEIYKYIMSDFTPFKVEGNPLTYIKDTIAAISEFKENEPNTIEDFSPEDRNFFIDKLTLYPNSFGITNKNKSKEYKDELYRSAYDLMQQDRALADKIFVASFLMNGFQTRLLDIKEYIPYQWFIENGIRDFIRTKNIELKDSAVSFQNFLTQFAKNNWENNIIVPTIPEAIVGEVKGKTKNTVFTLSGENPNHQRYKLLGDENTASVFPRFLKMNNNMFELHSYLGNTAFFVETTKSGFSDSSSFINLKEYSFDQDSSSNFLTDKHKARIQALNEWADDTLNEVAGYVPAYVRMLDTGPMIDISMRGLEDVITEDSTEDFTEENCE